MKIEILISTLNDGIYNIREVDDRFDYIVVHQVFNSSSDYSNKVDSFPDNVKYVKLKSKGLSLSRNVALSYASGDYLWIMDDDVEIYDSAYCNLLEYIVLYPDVDMFVLNHASCYDSVKLGFKERFLHKYNSFSISSIDMLIRRAAMESVVFNESFGLGTKLQSGEEYIFTCDLLKSGKKIFKTNTVFSYHPPITSGLDFYSTPEKMRAKLLMFRVTSGYFLGTLLYFLFVTKKIVKIYKEKSVMNIIKAFNNIT
ncbi:glycosyltransferase family 2 protein [Vibrio sp. 03-59-1]|uniref:glycosyltransferase family 2 protein n=1 Tax=Vibrio sp. 03-59-1 TaxID=2607607 RepID=UPI00149348A4|nr:glycosyltransferase family A protein [Vibrio sp. 03-59-1]NOH84559.1 glycosyltransferase family 2 protein [Vibrio sp. 03-59-1]